MSDNNIYAALRESHKIQRSLCRKLLRAAPHHEKREAIFHELKIELAAHAGRRNVFYMRRFCWMIWGWIRRVMRSLSIMKLTSASKR
jgi:hypothetical protein